MLVLTRKMDQELVLDHQGVSVKVLEIRGNRVRLGIVAPKGISIRRTNVMQQPVMTPPAGPR